MGLQLVQGVFDHAEAICLVKTTITCLQQADLQLLNASSATYNTSDWPDSSSMIGNLLNLLLYLASECSLEHAHDEL